MLKIISVGLTFKSSDVLNINFEDKQTLLDSDIVIIDPESFNRYWKDAHVLKNGITYLSSSLGSNQIRKTFELRKKEITTLLDKGKVLITFLSPIQKIHAEINNGKCDDITNYDFLPDDEFYILNDLVNGKGDSIKLHNPKHLFANYYKAYQNELEYFAYFDIKKIDSDNFFLLNKSDKLIGFSKNSKNGLLVFLPYPRNINEEKLLGVLIKCANPYLSKEIRTLAPEWIRDFEISGEAELVGKINSLNAKIQEIEKQKSEVERELNGLNEFKALLYEQGKLLEESAIRAFRILGFGAEKRKKDDMEHDIILTSPEGRAIVEVEGRDNDSIHIGKLDQLSRVVDEDFTLTGIYPEGILLGNHFRYVHPLKREAAFTDKVKIASGRKNLILLTTFELYKATNRVLKNPTDESLKKEFRIKIFAGNGKELRLTED